MTDGTDLPNDPFAPSDFEGPVDGAVPLEEPRFATILPVGGGRIVLPIGDEPQTILEACLAAGVATNNAEFWVDGHVVSAAETTLADGMMISAIGNIKGG